MANFILQKDAWATIKHDGDDVRVLKKSEVDRFNPKILGLGDISKPSRTISAVAAVFDLEGFTQFCGQIDPQFSVPIYLNRFLSWLMDQIKKETIQKEHAEGSQLWHPLPFFTKYMGDGLLVLWDASTLPHAQLHNLVVSLLMICENYPDQLLPQVKHTIVTPPSALRCGIARGTVYSVGESADYVGSCINMAARVQKLPGITVAFNRRGFDLESPSANDFIKKRFVVKRTSIRGISTGELLGILRSDLKEMEESDALLYEDP